MMSISSSVTPPAGLYVPANVEYLALDFAAGLRGSAPSEEVNEGRRVVAGERASDLGRR